MSERPVLSAQEICVSFKGYTAVDNVSIDLRRGETLGLVGESGSGKSTLAKCLAGQLRYNSGSVEYAGGRLEILSRRERQQYQRSVHMIPQDPNSSLNPRQTIGYTLSEAISPRRPQQRKNRDTVAQLLEAVNLTSQVMERYPHALSGGQRQRIAIARALAVSPQIIIADEITSALDVSVQAEILDLLSRLQAERELTMLFISHNLAVVEKVSSHVAVMKSGRLIENSSVVDVFSNPQQDYTRLLLDSIPGSAGFSLT